MVTGERTDEVSCTFDRCATFDLVGNGCRVARGLPAPLYQGPSLRLLAPWRTRQCPPGGRCRPAATSRILTTRNGSGGS